MNMRGWVVVALCGVLGLLAWGLDSLMSRCAFVFDKTIWQGWSVLIGAWPLAILGVGLGLGLGLLLTVYVGTSVADAATRRQIEQLEQRAQQAEAEAAARVSRELRAAQEARQHAISEAHKHQRAQQQLAVQSSMIQERVAAAEAATAAAESRLHNAQQAFARVKRRQSAGGPK